jgi:hypothetical protein
MRRATLIALTIGLLGGLIVWLPARWIAPLLPATVQCGAWHGTVWRGECAALTLANAPLGRAAWSLELAPLWRAQLALDVGLVAERSALSARIERSIFDTARLDLQALRLQATIVDLRRMLPQLPWPAGVDATLDVDLPQLVLINGVPSAARGGGAINGLRLPAPLDRLPTNYEWHVQPANGDQPPTLELADRGGEVEVRATLRYTRPRGYELQARLRPRSDDPQLQTWLAPLGARAPDGTYQYALAATY